MSRSRVTLATLDAAAAVAQRAAPAARLRHGPGERPPAGLVEAGNERQAGSPRPRLEAVRRRRSRRHAGRVAGYSVAVVVGTMTARFSFRRAALPARPRR